MGGETYDSRDSGDLLLLLPLEERRLFWPETQRRYDWDHLTAIAARLQQTTSTPLFTGPVGAQHRDVLARVADAELTALVNGLRSLTPAAGVRFDGDLTVIGEDASAVAATEAWAHACAWDLILEQRDVLQITVMTTPDGVSISS